MYNYIFFIIFGILLFLWNHKDGFSIGIPNPNYKIYLNNITGEYRIYDTANPQDGPQIGGGAQGPEDSPYDDIWEGTLELRQAGEIREYLEYQPTENPLPHFPFLNVEDRLRNVYKFTDEEVIDNVVLT